MTLAWRRPEAASLAVTIRWFDEISGDAKRQCSQSRANSIRSDTTREPLGSWWHV